MRTYLRIIAVIVVVLMITLTLQPAVFAQYDGEETTEEESRGPEEIPGPFRNLRQLVLDLIDKTPAAQRALDADNDGLPDNVEWVIGTNFMEPDSDFDKIPDYNEVINNMDPTEPDSNKDGLADVYEYDDDDPDPDGDGLPNAWDRDNDDDGIYDEVDMSPFMTSNIRSSFDFDVVTGGKPTYISLQIRTKNPDNMRLINQNYDWPYDKEGSMRDIDNSVDDVLITPLLEFTTDNPPEGPELEEYGIKVAGNVTYVPLFPVWDYGNIVALKAKMFFPATPTPVPIQGKLKLSWKVKGFTDERAIGLKVDIGGKPKYVAPGEDGIARATSDWLADEESFFWVEETPTRGGFQSQDGQYLTLDDQDRLVMSPLPLTDQGYFDLETVGSSKVLRAYNDKYLRVLGDGTIVADGNSTTTPNLLKFVDRGPLSRSTTLAIYYEDFAITGALFEEHYGTDAGVLYTDNVTQYFGANLKLAYDFLRNATNDITDVPDLMDDHGINITHNITAFEHKDTAIQALLVDMVHEATETIEDGHNRPVIMMLQESTASVSMEEIDNTTHILTKGISVDITKKPVVMSRMIKSPWYTRNSESPITMDLVMEEIDSWNISLDDKTTAASHMLAWSIGENFVLKVGPDIPGYYLPERDEIPFVVDGILDKGFAAISLLTSIIKGVKAAYEWTKVNKVSKLFTEPISSIKGISKTYSAISKVNTGALKVVNRIGDALDIIGLVIDIGIAIYCFFAIADAYDWSAMGVGIAALYAYMMIAYAVVLFAIGMIPVVGWIIALLITLSDLIVGWITGKGWSQRLMEWIIDMVTDWRVRSEIDVKIEGTDVIIHDDDFNGLDVGDRIEYVSNVTTQVNRTVDGAWIDVIQGYAKPRYTISVPTSSKSATGVYEYVIEERQDPGYVYKQTDYQIGAWAEPGVGMVNYPVTLTFNVDTRVHYDECWWAIVWWCTRKDNTETVSGDPSTMYYDVLPGSVDDFAKWRGITSNDWDGDGINNTDEIRTSQWKWDTDGDGLGDDFELDVGSIPWKYDSDGDGLNDMTEYLWQSNPRKKDTDGDGLNDYAEHNGWVVSFDYFGEPFNWHINSNPLFNDTDADGVNDFLEYRTLQNPRSGDTNGDGVIDEIRDYFETDFYHVKNPILGPHAKAIAVDGAGNIYISTNKDGTGTDPNCVVKYDKNGVRVGQPWDHWQIGGTTYYFSIISEIQIHNGVVYVCDVYAGITKWSTGGAYQSWVISENTAPGIRYPFAFDLDDDDNLYVCEASTHTVRVFNQQRQLVRVIGTAGNGDGQLNQPRSLAWHPDGFIYVGDNQNRIQKFAVNGTFIASYRSTVIGNLVYPHDIDVDRNGDLFITEVFVDRIQKTNANLSWIDTVCSSGDGDGEVDYPMNIVVTDDDYIYIADWDNYRVQKMWQDVKFVPASSYVVFTDTDGDGFNDTEEAKEWTVTVTNASGIIKFNVTSDIMSPDTDGDGLSDLKEFQILSDPRSPDTDGDGVNDAEELALGTDPINWDSDDDGLDDGVEVTFKSNPLVIDSDLDGLFDKIEWQLGSDPNSRDTDGDGLEDLLEVAFESDINDPDTDGDLMFDSVEYALKLSPTNPDGDGDGLSDGLEEILATDPANGDTDGDNLLDGFEVGMRINPNSNDTDGDTVLDSVELDVGLNPLSGDSDGDGVPDSLDLDYEVDLGQKVYLAIDDVGNKTRFIDKLSESVQLQMVDPQTLISSYKSARYIVLVGDPQAEDGTAGSLIRAVLESTPDLLERMSTSEEFHITVRYGMWAHTQTIVMISKPYPSDHIRVAGILKSMRMTVTDGAVAATYLNPRSCFMMDDADTVKQTDTVIWTKLDEMSTFSVGISRFTEDDTPFSLDETNGLEPGDEPLGKYVSVNVSESIQTNLTDMVAGSNIKVYYTVDELDTNGDGDADDPDDINEETLCLYRYDEEEGTWVKVREDLSWVTDAGVNTTDVTLYGKDYAGYVWAEIGHFSHFGAGGRPNTFLPTVADAGADIAGYTQQIIEFNGTASHGNGDLNYTWTFHHRSQLVTLYGPVTEFVFTEPGDYVVTLLVKDDYNVVDGDTVFVNIRAMAEKMFDLAIGPIVDEHGDPIEGANVRLSVSDYRFFGETDEDGMATINMAAAFQGRKVEILVVKSGFDPLEFNVRISKEGVLEEPVPTFYRELSPVVAHAGLDRVSYVGEVTMLDGSLSWGNGGIVNYTWTFNHKGGKRVLHGMTPTFVFEVAGTYPVTLNVTDFRGLSAEAVVSLTLVDRPVEDFTLFVGPVMDQHNLPVADAQVVLYIGDEEYSGTTLQDGVAYIIVPGSVRGADVDVRITGLKIDPIEYSASITDDGKMDTAVPEAHSTAKHSTPGVAEGGFPAWAIGAIIAIIVVILLVFLIVTKRIGGRRRDSFEEMEQEPDVEVEGPEPSVDDDLEALIVETHGETTDEGTPEEDVHVIKPPQGEGGLKERPKTTSRKQPDKPVERQEDSKELSSVDADSEVEATSESEDTNI